MKISFGFFPVFKRCHDIFNILRTILIEVPSLSRCWWMPKEMAKKMVLKNKVTFWKIMCSKLIAFMYQLSIENSLLGILGAVKIKKKPFPFHFEIMMKIIYTRESLNVLVSERNSFCAENNSILKYWLLRISPNTRFVRWCEKKLASFQEMYLERISSVLINQLPQYTSNFYVCLLYEYFIHTFD